MQVYKISGLRGQKGSHVAPTNKTNPNYNLTGSENHRGSPVLTTAC